MSKTLIVTPETPVLVAVYGTLLSGLHNNYLLQDSRCLGKGRSDFWGTMFSAGGFPILSLDEPTSRIEVEVYEVKSQEVMDDLDGLEGFPSWYDRDLRTFTIFGEKARAWIYHQPIDSEAGRPIVESGDWKHYKKEGL